MISMLIHRIQSAEIYNIKGDKIILHFPFLKKKSWSALDGHLCVPLACQNMHITYINLFRR